ncbi:hypothetical protein PENCOP_c009G06650 [Penicillium coprophilum]|uniref:Uncharacterized protein n=1 Tax=Penicillium coprophilum TaxID=36646 RepID=A0A1V6UH71_9EURO|nr:hypothetical protein PENCOP_c009G06650 [Penicillium coprophilum]
MTAFATKHRSQDKTVHLKVMTTVPENGFWTRTSLVNGGQGTSGNYAGAGKSVLASIIIQHLLDLQKEFKDGPQSAKVAYLYLSYKEPHSLDQLLGSIIKQVVIDDIPLPQSLTKLWERCNSGTVRPTLSALMDLLQEVTCDRPVYLVVDALDEYPLNNRKELMDRLRDCKNLFLLITSRVLPEWEELAGDCTTVEIRANPKDLDLFLEHGFQETPRLRRFEEKSPGLLEQIKLAVHEACSGMFLLASLHMRSIICQRSIEGVKDRIRSLPQDINGMYNDTLARVRQLEEDDVKLALGILSWVVFSYRPLKINEIQHCMAVDLDSERFNENRMIGEESMREVCEGLVTVTNGVISLVHYTAQSFFKEKRHELFPGFHATIARTCITYLSLKALEQPDDLINQQSYADDLYDMPDARTANEILESAHSTSHHRLSYYQKRAKFPFLTYASEFLPRHLRDLGAVSVLDNILGSLQRLLQDRPKRNFFIRTMSEHYPQLNYIVRLLEPLSLTEDIECYLHSQAMIPSHKNGSHMAPRNSASFLTSFVKELQRKLRPEHNSSRDLPARKVVRETTALHLAVFLGWRPTVTHLLHNIKHPAGINAVDANGRTPLTIAASERHWDIVPLLLNSGASVDLLSSDGHAVLLQAAQRDREDIVQRVIVDLMHPLIYEISHVKLFEYIVAVIVAFILEVFFLVSGYFPTYDQVGDIERRCMTRLLHLATYRKENDSQLGAHLKLLTAALSGDCRTIKGLVHDGTVQFKSQTSCFHNTAVFLAVEFDQKDAAAELLENGADINMRGLKNCTLLHRAASRNSISMVQMLLDRNPTIDRKDDDGLTAWSANLDEEHNSVLAILHRAGADPNTTVLYGENKLYSSAAAGNLRTVRFLLRQGVNPSIKTDYGWTPLHWAAANGFPLCIDELRRAKADLNPISDVSKTPLDLAIERNQQDIAKTLRDAGAKTAREVVAETGGRNMPRRR